MNVKEMENAINECFLRHLKESKDECYLKFFEDIYDDLDRQFGEYLNVDFTKDMNNIFKLDSDELEEHIYWIFKDINVVNERNSSISGLTDHIYGEGSLKIFELFISVFFEEKKDTIKQILENKILETKLDILEYKKTLVKIK